MGFFSLKENCSICDKEAGLNRYKIKKSNAWICNDCFKKAGGFLKADIITKMSIEEIQELIEKNKIEKEKQEILIKNNPFETAEGMYQYCLDNKLGSGWNRKWGTKHFKIIEENLLPGEEIKMPFIGLHNSISVSKHDGHFAYALTNKRIMMAQKKAVTGEIFQTVSLNNINDITFQSGLIYGKLTIDTIKETFNIEVDKETAKTIKSSFHVIMNELKNVSVTSDVEMLNTAQNKFSIADELKKYKELLDLGILTQEEFEIQKNKLLNS